MGIDDKSFIDSKRVSKHDIRSFASNTIELNQFIHHGWNLAVIFFNQLAAGSLDIPGFVAKQAESLKLFFQI